MRRNSGFRSIRVEDGGIWGHRLSPVAPRGKIVQNSSWDGITRKSTQAVDDSDLEILPGKVQVTCAVWEHGRGIHKYYKRLQFSNFASIKQPK